MSCTRTASQSQAARDAKVARALQTRIADIEDEMGACVRLAVAHVAEFLDLADTRHKLTMALWDVERRLAAAQKRRRMNGATPSRGRVSA